MHTLPTEEQQSIDIFTRQGRLTGYADFLLLAAQPLLFSTDLLYKLWANFKAYRHKQPQKQASQLVVSDLVLSSLCLPVGNDLFRLKPSIRASLVAQLEPTTRQAVALFIKDYAQHYKASLSPNIYEIYALWAKGVLDARAMEAEIMERLNTNTHPSQKINYLSLYFNTIDAQPDGKGKARIGLELANDEADPQVLGRVLPEGLRKRVKGLEKVQEIKEIKENSLDAEVKVRIKKAKNLQEKVLILNGLGLNTIPDEIFELKHLETIRLERNQITEISSKIAQLKNLKSLYLGSNLLQELPPSIVELRELHYLNLKQNLFTKNLSTAFKIPQLTSLHLSGNKIQQIPTEPSLYEGLKRLDLSNNQIEIVPTFFGNLPKLERLWLDENPITNVPTSIYNFIKFDIDVNSRIQKLKDFLVAQHQALLALENNEFIYVFEHIKGVAKHFSQRNLLGLSQLRKLFAHNANAEYLRYKLNNLILGQEFKDLKLTENIINKSSEIQVLFDLLEQNEVSRVINTIDYMSLTKLLGENGFETYQALRKDFVNNQPSFGSFERLRLLLTLLALALDKDYLSSKNIEKNIDLLKGGINQGEITRVFELLLAYQGDLEAKDRRVLKALVLNYIKEPQHPNLPQELWKFFDILRGKYAYLTSITNETQTINLSHQQITHLENVLAPLESKKVSDLNLSNNAIENLAPINQLTELTSLDLSHNQIRNIDSLRLPQLHTLDLRHNQIDQITKNFLDKHPKLKILYLEGNPLEGLPKAILPEVMNDLPKLKSFFYSVSVVLEEAENHLKQKDYDKCLEIIVAIVPENFRTHYKRLKKMHLGFDYVIGYPEELRNFLRQLRKRLFGTVTIQEALELLEEAKYNAYFEVMDNIIDEKNKGIYRQLRNQFIHSGTDKLSIQRLVVFTQQIAQEQNKTSIADSLIEQFKQQIHEQYRIIIRYRALKNNTLDRKKRAVFQEEIDLRAQNIQEMQASFLGDWQDVTTLESNFELMKTLHNIIEQLDKDEAVFNPEPAVIFTAFANPQGDLLGLSIEQDRTQRILMPLEQKNTIAKHIIRTDLDLGSFFNILKMWENLITIFHFGGHISGEKIALQNGSTFLIPLMKELIRRNSDSLKLIFLNGCASQAHVQTLFELGAKAVIAISDDVEDNFAANFAYSFYKNMAEGDNIQQAFTSTVNYILANQSLPDTSNLSATPIRWQLHANKGEFPWGLYVNDEEVLNYSLFPSPEQQPIKELYAKLAQEEVRKIRNLIAHARIREAIEGTSKLIDELSIDKYYANALLMLQSRYYEMEMERERERLYLKDANYSRQNSLIISQLLNLLDEIREEIINKYG